MIRPIGSPQYEVSAGGHGDRAQFDEEGCGVGRAVLAPAAVAAIRAPLTKALIEHGHAELVDDEPDRLRWIGDRAKFNRHEYLHHLEGGVEELLLKSGLAAEAVETVWGTPAAIWEEIQLFVSVPGQGPSPHRDATPVASTTESSGQVRLWFPLTELGDGDGSLALAVGSHRIPDRAARTPPLPHVLHPDLETIYTRWIPFEEDLAPLWRTPRLRVGDAIVFRSDVVHTSAPNDGRFLRISVVLTAQDARVPVGLAAGMSLDAARPLTDLESVILAILAVQPTSPWRARCACYPRGIVGRTWGEQESERVERAFVTLAARDLIEPYEFDGAESIALQRYFQATANGRAAALEWLARPALSDSRLQSLKQLLSDWLGVDVTDDLQRHTTRSAVTAAAERR
jgi:Phytanoyl-CoA dioxygenase (PhyH)